MPAWLEYILTPIVVYAALFLITWFLARDKVSRRVSLFGWTAVAITASSVLWSLWSESLSFYVHTKRWSRGVLALMQPLVMFAGVGLMIYGAVQFLRAWMTFTMWTPLNVLPALRGYIRGTHPHLEEIRGQVTLRARFVLAAKRVLHVSTLPGLGWVFVGLGVTIGGAQALEPDPSIVPDIQLLTLAAVLMGVGGVQLWVARRKGDVE